MASISKKIIFVALIITITVPTSMCNREGWRRSDETDKNTEQYLIDLCSQTNRSNDCWKILKPESYRFNGSDEKTAIEAVIDLAANKSKIIHDRLNKLYTDSRNEQLKEKYITCSKNYNDVNRNLVVARQNVDSKNHKSISVQLKDAVEELKSCEREFEWGSFDPAHIGDRNKELGLYLDIVSVAAKSFRNHN